MWTVKLLASAANYTVACIMLWHSFYAVLKYSCPMGVTPERPLMRERLNSTGNKPNKKASTILPSTYCPAVISFIRVSDKLTVRYVIEYCFFQIVKCEAAVSAKIGACFGLPLLGLAHPETGGCGTLPNSREELSLARHDPHTRRSKWRFVEVNNSSWPVSRGSKNFLSCQLAICGGRPVSSIGCRRAINSKRLTCPG
jgi:hypothetical protein